jgi:hypothetical protein
MEPVDGLEVYVKCVGTLSNNRLVVMLEVETVGDGAAHPLYRLIAQPQTTKVFEWSSLSHLDGDEGDDLLEKTVPGVAAILFAGSMVLRCGKVEGKIMQVLIN